ncbi:MAG: serine/threonine protein kinase [Lentisphaeria bacterium]|nr:serine/threonine protein kinase [Lentisphaeria bacterium]
MNGGESPPLVIFCYNCEQKLDATNLPAFSVVNCPSCQAPLIVPRWFDSYLLEEIVGEGGMATVYRALDLALDREVAIKIMSVTGDTDADFHTLFLEEARTAATINHQAVVAIYTCSVAEEKPYIVMEFMGGGSLEKVLEEKKEPLDILQVCQWMQDIAEGLERAEKYGIIHHDIKPANIMLDLEGNVKIGDFGIAQRRFDQAASSGGSENLWGSPFYVSPEKARDGVESFPGDIYSLGATFYHLLTGVPPFNGYENIEELVYVRIEKDPPLPSAIRREIPSEVDALIMKMMHRDPEKRPTYPFVAAELAKIIKKYKSGAFFHAVAVSAKKGINLPPAANDTGFYPITAEQEKNKAAAAEDPENRTGNTPAEKGKMEKKKRRSAGYVTMLVAASIAGAAGIFFILYVLFRFMFSSMKG